ncbi:MAG: HAD family phosphatase [Patescibacteria group bacterium]|nr:HAD family phosphatase [Patescibacteria group bacterium]
MKKTSNNKAVIFDLDGTLTDSVHAHYLKHERIGKILGYDLTEKYFHESANGMDAKDFFPALLKHYGINLGKNLKKAIKLHHKLTDEEFFSHIKLFPHVKTILKNLKKEGYKLALASSSPADMVIPTLKQFDIEKYFDIIVNGDDVLHTKPNPAIFLLARKKLGIKKADCIVIEDAPKGVDAAKRANIKCICLTTSNTIDEIPDYASICHSHKNLLEMIKSSF